MISPRYGQNKCKRSASSPRFWSKKMLFNKVVPPEIFSLRLPRAGQLQFNPTKNTRNEIAKAKLGSFEVTADHAVNQCPPSVSLHDVHYIPRRHLRTYTLAYACTRARKPYVDSHVRFIRFLALPFVPRTTFKCSLRQARFMPCLHCPDNAQFEPRFWLSPSNWHERCQHWLRRNVTQVSWREILDSR